MQVRRAWAMPNAKTFTIGPIRELIRRQVNALGEGIVVVDPYANNMSINEVFEHHPTYISNDLDTQYPTDYHLDATDFLKQLPDASVDVVLFDAPYSPRQVSEVYKKFDRTVNMQTTQASYWGNQKKEIARIVKPGGKVLTFGWNSGGIGKSNGFDIEEVLLVPHGGWHNDTICTVDVRRCKECTLKK